MHLMAKVGVVETFGQNINLTLSGQTSATGANKKETDKSRLTATTEFGMPF